MILARVEGSILAPASHPSMRGRRHVVVQPIDERGSAQGSPVVALDPLGAGMHQVVVVSSDGATTRQVVGDKFSPLRQIIIAILDRDPADEAAR